MTPQRAKEIIAQAKTQAQYGPWSDQLSKVMTYDERREVIIVWDTMPDHTCFVDALYNIANQPETLELCYTPKNTTT